MFSPQNCFVDPDIKRAELLPAAAFTDEEFLELELRTIFTKTWLLIPPENHPPDILKPEGARVPFSLLGKPLFLQRGSRGQLHCFPNVCTHAWHPLVEGSAVSRTIICPQHGRQFDVEGRFVSQAGFNDLENFPRNSDHLRSVPVEEWAQFAFACLGRPMAPFLESVGEVQNSVPGISLEKLRRHSTESDVREVDGNWKQHAWNYMDNFHIRFIHKGPGGLADAIGLASYRTELYKFSSLQWVYARKPENGFNPEAVHSRLRDPKNSGKRVFALWWFIFPNLALNFYPWGLSVNQYMPVPKKPDKTRFLWYNYALDDEKFRRRNDIWLSEQVDAEDIEAISNVSRGGRVWPSSSRTFRPTRGGWTPLVPQTSLRDGV